MTNGLDAERIFSCPKVTDAGEDGLISNYKRRTPCLSDIRNSGSIKGCLMFVQKYFYAGRDLREQTSKFVCPFGGGGVQGERLFHLPQGEIYSIECFFYGGKFYPSLPVQNPVGSFHPASFDRRANQGRKSLGKRVTVVEENYQREDAQRDRYDVDEGRKWSC